MTSASLRSTSSALNGLLSSEAAPARDARSRRVASKRPVIRMTGRLGKIAWTFAISSIPDINGMWTSLMRHAKSPRLGHDSKAAHEAKHSDLYPSDRSRLESASGISSSSSITPMRGATPGVIALCSGMEFREGATHLQAVGTDVATSQSPLP